MGNKEEEASPVIFKDIRRYYCDFCEICRSKKSLISSHMLANHEEEMKEKEKKEQEGDEKLSICEKCGMSFRKPAHRKQHMLSHSLDLCFFESLCQPLLSKIGVTTYLR